MRIRRIEVQHFRKIGHLAVEGLDDGLNVLVGDNEAGKSTLLAALRAVFFERHRVGGKVLQAMLPHGQDVRPSISVDFQLGDALYRLRKAFNQRPEAELTGTGISRVTGEAVEERLAALLGFNAPGPRGSRPDEHQGVHGLLWVDQGLAHASFDAGAGHGTLASALESEVGQVLGGERGRHLLAAAERRRDEFWDKRDVPKPKGALRALQDEVVRCEAQRGLLVGRLRLYDEKVALLSAKAEALQRCTRDDRLAGAVQALEAAQWAMTRTGQLQATFDELSRTRHRADLDTQIAAQRAADRRALISRAEADRARANLLSAEADDAQVALRTAEREAQQASARLCEASASREQADATLASVERALAARKAREDQDRVARTLADAEAVDRLGRTTAAAARRITLTRKDLDTIDRLQAERDAARLRCDAASVHIVLEPRPGMTLAIDGEPVDRIAPLLLSKDSVLDLGGFGRVTIRPGGGVSELADALVVAERRLSDQLRQRGQPSRNDAANLLRRKTDLTAEAANHERVFAILAPHGIDVLRAELLALQALGDADADDAETRPTQAARAACRTAWEESKSVEAAARLRAERSGEVRERAARHLAVLAERATIASRDAEAAASALAAARQTVDDRRLDDIHAETLQQQARCRGAEEAARIALDAADPDTVALTLRRAEGAEAAIRMDIDTLAQDKRDLDIELRIIGQEGLGELLEETEGKLALLKHQAASTVLEAEASLLLHRTLAAAQRESKDRWLGPVRDRVRPYLKLIQPDSEIVLNEKTFSIEHLVRGGISEPFDTLSVGAREQVAVITRLALADILRTSGYPSAIILDDALVNTDQERLDRMHLVLQKAAETLQVIVLTCRERDFCSLGAPIRRF